MNGFKVSGMPPLMDWLDAVIHCVEDGGPSRVHEKPESSLRIFLVLGL